jgi:single-stranded-DNA-specific exonuclease
MSIQRFKWIEPIPISEEIDHELQDFPKPLREILFQRNISTIADAIAFLLPKKKDWYTDFSLLHIDKCCQLIQEAIDREQTIALYGDYDADGITSLAALYLALSKITGKLIPYIPSRFEEGYGLNIKAIKSLSEEGADLLITVDNGIRSVEEVDYANSIGLKVIITDHHSPVKTLPNAAAVINPKAPDDPYPNKNLAGVGVVYKLICALHELYPIIIPEDYLDLVAIGTIADVVPLVGENRFLARRGLSHLNKLQRQGIVSLLGVSNLINQKINSSDISFQIAPRLNAAGRLGSAYASFNLMTSSDPNTCGLLAQKIDNINRERKKVGQEMILHADIYSNVDALPPILITFHRDYHPGVSGIVAGNLTRKYYLPAIVGQIGEHNTVASCRSIPDFDMISALDQLKDLLLRHGGHQLAAGFTIENSKIPLLKERLSDLAHSALAEIELKPKISIDSELLLSELDSDLYKALQKIEPTGEGNQEAVFLSRKLQASEIKVVGSDQQHLKLKLTDGKLSVDAIGFGLGDYAPSIPPVFDAIYNFQINHYQGKSSFQLSILDLKAC